MAASKLFETVGKIGLGLAITGGILNSALYNGEQKRQSFSFSADMFNFTKSGVKLEGSKHIRGLC